MEEKRIVDYFVVAGLPDNPEPLEEFSNEATLKPTHKQDPIVDIAVIIRSLGETPPKNYKCVETTPSGLPADLNHGSIRAPEVYLCYRRGRDKPPITDLGVLYEGKERVMQGCEIVHASPYGRPANVNNSNSSRTYITYRRADGAAASDTLAVTDICVILANKSEVPPHAFCQIPKNLNKGMVGSDVFLCYKKSMAKANTLAYKPATLYRWPLEDYPNFEFPESVPMFCLPLGSSVESWPALAQHPLPVFSTFVLTGAGGEKVYGAAIMFYEEFDETKLTDQQKTQLGLEDSLEEEKEEEKDESLMKTVHHNKCICLLSRWPFFDAFKKFLQYLYRLSVSGPHIVPIERHISHFMLEVPFPSPQRPRILVQLADDSICISQPEEMPLQQNFPCSGASFTLLLKNLGPENCLNLLLYALMEQKILIHSLRPAVLTSVAEALTNMIFPFHWQCPYIPLCPLGLSDVLNAPIPFIVGVDSRYFDLYDPPSDITCIDLDTNTISLSDERKGMSHKMLPKKPMKVLRATLERLFETLCQEPSNPGTPIDAGRDMAYTDHDFRQRRKELLTETAIQEAFLRFMACCLKGYNQYLLPITKAPTLGTTDVSSLFDVNSFLKSRDKTYHKFFMQLMKTQLFSRFIEERSFVSDKDASLAFFDECTEKVDDYRDEPKLIELDDTSKSERTVFIMPPEPVGLPEGLTYTYNGFPDLREETFLPRPKLSFMTPLKTPACPNSPMTRRTKQEVRSAQKIAQKHVGKPVLWAKCLLGHCYSLWFIHLPAYVKSVHSKTKALRTAYEVLVKMQSAKLQPPDEVCYRVLMQLCGLYHQPVLAVKVLFEMKRNGVHPNAITYGFYNKAVLESKWPSSDTNAYLLWTKVRNAIMAVAQFRKALRRRRLSVYSTSESDFERCSRTSTDSLADDIQPLDKVDAAKTEFVTDLVSVESPNMEERTSTGGMSDRGYSSMTLEDAKRISTVIGSQESIDSLTRLSGKNGTRPIAKITAANKKYINFKKERSASKEGAALAFATIDPKADEAFRQRVGSIVRKSVGSLGSGSTLRGGSSTLGSSAGLLMTSQSSINEAVFGEFGVSHSLSKAQHPNSSLYRKRHKSFGDQIKRRRALSLQEEGSIGEEKQRHQSLDGTFEGEVTGDSQLTPRVDTSGKFSLLSQKACNGAGDTEDEVLVSPNVNGVESVNGPLVNGTVNGISELRTSVLQDSIPPDIDMSDGLGMGNGNLSSDTLKSEQLLDLDCSCKSVNESDTTVFSDIQSECQLDESEKPSSKPNSPAHVVRTPVTENDPLGLFMSPALQQSTPATAADTMTTPSSGPRKLLFSVESDANDSGVSSMPAHSTGNRSNLLIDLEPFSSTPSKKSPAALFTIGSSPERKGKREEASEKPGQSVSSSDASSPGSPEAWAPLSQSHSQSQIRNSTPDAPQAPSPEHLKKAATLPAYMDKQGEIKHCADKPPLSSGKKGKPVSRADSFGFGSALKSAAHLFSSKFNELKQTMVTPTKGEANGLQTNLPKPHEMEKVLYEQEEDMFLRKAGSLDHLGRSNNLASGDDRADGASLDGHLDAAPKIRQQKGYTPFVNGLWEGLLSLQNLSMQGLSGLSAGLPALQGLTQSIDSLKGARSEDSLDSKTSATTPDKGSAPPHSTLDQYISAQDMDLGVASAIQSKSANNAMVTSGSVTSIPQALFNMAMEVEICSLSRCTSCLSLLYDEEIMAGWSADDSNLNTTCQFCSSKLVPFLQIQVKDYRQSNRPFTLTPSQSSESMQSVQSMPTAGGTNAHPGTGPISSSTRPTPSSGINRSLTSLNSTDSAHMGVIEEVKQNGDVAEEAEEQSQESKNKLSSDPKVEKLISFSPNNTPTHEPKTPAGEDDKQDQSSTSENNATGEKAEKRRSKDMDALSQTSMAEEEETMSNASTKDAERKKSVNLEPMTVPYLSPLVLRKEVENVLEQEGDLCLSKPQFVDEHPIIFWNLVWFFRRIDVPSHLPGFVLTATSTNPENTPPKSRSAADSRHVVIRTVWDNLRMHEQLGPPMYVLWNNSPHESPVVNALITESQTISRSVMQHTLSSIMCNDVVTPIRQIITERQKHKFVKGKPRFRSIYRDILFLAFTALGRENIDHDAFEREYTNAFGQLTARDIGKLRKFDRPPNKTVHFCRKMFGELEL